MKEYVIKKQGESWENIEKAYINEYPWGKDYCPVTYFQAIHNDDAFIIRLTCEEKSPKAVHEGYMAPVYKDSCLEFFACYAKGGYINCEVNSIGAALIAYGADRHERTPLLELCGMLPEVKAETNDGLWQVTITMPYEIIGKVYGDITISSGYEFYGNAYKCGDDCEIPHYGMWNAATCEKPDFHRPEDFGTLIFG